MRLLAQAFLGLLLTASSGHAADLPAHGSTESPAAIAVPSTWSGFYVGAHGGYASGDSVTRLADVYPGGLFALDLANRTLPTRVAGSRAGPLAGLQTGYNLQIGRYVLGLEGDASFADVRGTASFSGVDLVAFPGLMTRTTFRSELTALGSLRARGGFAFDRLLIYGTGGAAIGDVRTTVGVNIPGAYAHEWSRTAAEWGWVAGAGIEYALTGNLTFKTEYLRYDLGSRTTQHADPPAFGAEYIGYKSDIRGNTVRSGLNVRF
jgi:outer membrane immunogenic protein